MRRALIAIAVATAACRGGPAARPQVVTGQVAARSLLDLVPVDTGAVLLLDGDTPAGRAVWETGRADGAAWSSVLDGFVDTLGTGKDLTAEQRQAGTAIARTLQGWTAAERARAGFSPDAQAVAYLWGLTPVLRVRGDGAWVLAQVEAAAAREGVPLALQTRGDHRYLVAPDMAPVDLVIVFEPDQLALAVTRDVEGVLDHLTGAVRPEHALTRAALAARAGAGASGEPIAALDPAAIARALADPAQRARAPIALAPECQRAFAELAGELPPMGMSMTWTPSMRDWSLVVGPAPRASAWLRAQVGPVPRWPAPQADVTMLGTGAPLVPTALALAEASGRLDRVVEACGGTPPALAGQLGSLPGGGLDGIRGLTLLVRGTDTASLGFGAVIAVDDPIALWTWLGSTLRMPLPPAAIGGQARLPLGAGSSAVFAFEPDAIAVGLNTFTMADVRALLAAPPGPRSALLGWLDVDVSAAIGSGGADRSGSGLKGDTAVEMTVTDDVIRVRMREQNNAKSRRSTH